MYKKDSVEGSKLPQRTKPNIDYKKNSKILILSSNISECSNAYPTPEQTFLYNLWNSFESAQDSMRDQSSSEFQILEIVNPILFNIWVKTGRRL